uniref:Uncharacterized protein n=1 Tax=viral metagenome TaxID=1070528 RepID=A0A6C0F9C1_9ZZZZ
MTMIFYSILTYFIGPLVTRNVFSLKGSENCIVGFTLGFALSVILWAIWGKTIADMKSL